MYAFGLVAWLFCGLQATGSATALTVQTVITQQATVSLFTTEVRSETAFHHGTPWSPETQAQITTIHTQTTHSTAVIGPFLR